MACSEEMNSVLDRVDSIQRKFMESLITGRRDPIFNDPISKPAPPGELPSDSPRTEGAQWIEAAG